MSNCPNCGTKVNSEGKSGLFKTKNKFISEDYLKSINLALQDTLQFECICEKCIDSSSSIMGGVYLKLQHKIKELKQDRTAEISKDKQELENQLREESIKIVKCYSITPTDFKPNSLVESVIMFDSGARSTSSDNLNAGVWNVVNDSIALKLGNTESVLEAINAVKSDIQYKCLILGCDTVADLKPVYSDLAANGKILLHMSGTSGLEGVANISDKAYEIINSLKTNHIQTKANEKLIQDLQRLIKRFDNQEFLASK